MTLHELRAAAEMAKKNDHDDVYFYSLLDGMTPDLILTLLNDREQLVAAMTKAKGVCAEGGPVWNVLAPAIQQSEDLWSES